VLSKLLNISPNIRLLKSIIKSPMISQLHSVLLKIGPIVLPSLISEIRPTVVPVGLLVVLLLCLIDIVSLITTPLGESHIKTYYPAVPSVDLVATVDSPLLDGSGGLLKD